MKKRFLIIPAITMLFGAGLVFATNKVAEVRAEEIVETISESEEDNSLYQEALAKLQEIKEKQFVRSLIGALTGGLGSALISTVFMFVNRDTMKQSIVVARKGEKTISTGIEQIENYTKQSKETSEKAEKSIVFLKQVDEKANEIISHAESILANQETINNEHKEEIDLLLTIINSSKDLVANGTAEKLNKIYRK